MDMKWLAQAQRELDAALLPDRIGVACAELREAGVSERRIAILYPFEARAYRAGARKALDNTISASSNATLDVLQRGFGLSQIEWTLSRWLPRTTSVRWEAEISSARDSARTRTRSHGPHDPALANARMQLLTNMYLLPVLIHELQRYPFEGEQWNDAAQDKLARQMVYLRAAVDALCTVAQS